MAQKNKTLTFRKSKMLKSGILKENPEKPGSPKQGALPGRVCRQGRMAAKTPGASTSILNPTKKQVRQISLA